MEIKFGHMLPLALWLSASVRAVQLIGLSTSVVCLSSQGSTDCWESTSLIATDGRPKLTVVGLIIN